MTVTSVSAVFNNTDTQNAEVWSIPETARQGDIAFVIIGSRAITSAYSWDGFTTIEGLALGSLSADIACGYKILTNGDIGQDIVKTSGQYTSSLPRAVNCVLVLRPGSGGFSLGETGTSVVAENHSGTNTTPDLDLSGSSNPMVILGAHYVKDGAENAVDWNYAGEQYRSDFRLEIAWKEVPAGTASSGTRTNTGGSDRCSLAAAIGFEFDPFVIGSNSPMVMG